MEATMNVNYQMSPAATALLLHVSHELPVTLIDDRVLEVRALSSVQKQAAAAVYPEGDKKLPWFAAFTRCGFLVVISDDPKQMRKKLKAHGYQEHNLDELR